MRMFLVLRNAGPYTSLFVIAADDVRKAFSLYVSAIFQVIRMDIFRDQSSELT